MKQQNIDVNSFEKYRKRTHKEVFLEQMNDILPWAELCQTIEPFYPKASRLGGRPTIGIERMLRVHFLHHWFELSDPSVEEGSMIHAQCASLLISIWPRSLFLMRRRFVSFAI